MTKKAFAKTAVPESRPSTPEEHRCSELELDEFIDLLATSEFPDELKHRTMSVIHEAEASEMSPSDQTAYVSLARLVGGSWSEVALAAGMSKSSAYRRWSGEPG
jgi:hypothetical protein